MIKFSIITITYNAEAVLGRTLESVEAQNYPGVEHLIVDGASKDGTVRLASEYKERSDASHNGHEVRIVSEPDRGLYDAMNKGLGLASGDYVCFLNAGDTLHSSSTLSDLCAKARLNTLQDEERPLPAVVYGDTDIVDGEGNFICRRRLSPPERLTWRSFKNGMLVCHQAFYARTDIAKRIRYDLRYRFSSDVDWCIRIMKEAEKNGLPLVNVHETVADYQQEGQTTLHHKASLKERFDVMSRHYGLLTTMIMHLWFVVRAVLKK